MRQIDKVIIFDNFGLAKVMFDFNEHKLIVDEVLLSGFLSAIDGLSQSIFQGQSSYFIIDNGNQKISLFKNRNIVLAAISNESLIDFKDQMHSLLQYFEEKYDITQDEVFDNEFYEEFRIKLIRILFFLPIAQDWIPVLKNDMPKLPWFQQQFPLMEKINGKKEIQNFENYSIEIKEEIFEILNYAFFEDILTFKNIIESKDYIVGSEKLQNLLLGKSDEYKILKNQFFNFNLLNICKDVQNYSRILDLQSKFGDNVINVIEELYNLGYITLVGDEIRKLLNAVDLIEDLIIAFQKVGRKGKIIPEIKFFVEEFDEPEIISRFQFDKNQISLNKENLFDISNQFQSTKKSVDLWLHFGELLLDKFYLSYEKKLNNIFQDSILNKYLSCLHREDMAILDPFLSKLEASCFDE
ncbi:hypothetical protein NEF87_004972 [Candidatus Lokiarchaeum ossiferum]|uniref:Uncharacterized protein n=1 Tax=Candidatus Lokiarchaeum ossiferum TaxID=2951803 RepID=A0ABY6I0P2_9ARCH|nr:hypothetical protein NEF87_004972 [Candidatus Lokiarchaeum sp. B-35]